MVNKTIKRHLRLLISTTQTMSVHFCIRQPDQMNTEIGPISPISMNKKNPRPVFKSRHLTDHLFLQKLFLKITKLYQIPRFEFLARLLLTQNSIISYPPCFCSFFSLSLIFVTRVKHRSECCNQRATPTQGQGAPARINSSTKT